MLLGWTLAGLWAGLGLGLGLELGLGLALHCTCTAHSGLDTGLDWTHWTALSLSLPFLPQQAISQFGFPTTRPTFCLSWTWTRPSHLIFLPSPTRQTASPPARPADFLDSSPKLSQLGNCFASARPRSPHQIRQYGLCFKLLDPGLAWLSLAQFGLPGPHLIQATIKSLSTARNIHIHCRAHAHAHAHAHTAPSSQPASSQESSHFACRGPKSSAGTVPFLSHPGK